MEAAWLDNKPSETLKLYCNDNQMRRRPHDSQKLTTNSFQKFLKSKSLESESNDLYLKLTQQWSFDAMGVENEYAAFEEVLDGLH